MNLELLRKAEAMASRDSCFRKDAINDEMDFIMSNHTKKLVDLPAKQH